jgi:hypothetical protein
MEFKKERIARCVEMICKNRDINYLTKEAYQFITLYCGSIAHFDIEGWKSVYSDLRDFLNFFLVRNEYGDCLVHPPERMNLSQENKQIVLEIVSICMKYKEEIFKELDQKEREASIEIARRLLSGQISLKQLVGADRHWKRGHWPRSSTS